MSVITTGSVIYTSSDPIVNLEAGFNKTLNLKGTVTVNDSPLGTSYASVYASPGSITPTTIPVIVIPVPILMSTYTQGLVKDFTVDTASGAVTYTGQDTAVFKVYCAVNGGSGAGTTSWSLVVYVDGLGVDDTANIASDCDAAPNKPISVDTLVTLSTGSVVQVHILNETGTNSIIVNKFGFNITKL